MPRVVIVGAGISGLSLAFRLQLQLPNLDLTILERSDRVGGAIWTLRRDGFQVETGPNGFLDAKPSTLQLCRDLGLGDRLVHGTEAASKNRYLFLDGRLRMLPGSLGSFLKTDLLSWRGKLRLLGERFCRRGKLEESIDHFAKRRGGAEAAEIFADALVTGIYAGDPKLLSLPACFPRIAALERTYGSVMKGLGATAKQRRREGQPRPGKMWSFPDGLRVLVEALRDRTKKPPVLGVNIRKMERQGPTWIIHGEGRERWEAEVLHLTCPAHQQAALLADVDPALAEQIAGIPYNRVAVVALGFRQSDIPMSLDGFGYIAPQRTRRDLLGVQWCSSIYPGRAPEGAVLLRALAGGWHRADVVGWDDARLVDAIRAELKLAMGIAAAPIFQEIIRWDRAIPQYHLGHLDRVAWIAERCKQHPGLFLGGNAYHGVAINDCTERAVELAAATARTMNS